MSTLVLPENSAKLGAAHSLVGGMGMALGFGSHLLPLLRAVSLMPPEASALLEDRRLFQPGGLSSAQVPGTLCPRPLGVDLGLSRGK